MTDALVAADVRRRYGDVEALSGVSLSVGEGEVFALVGPNGAGKTTLVRALTGTTRPDDGEVALLGVDPVDADPERLGVLPQSFAPPGRLTAREVVAYYAGLFDDARDVDGVLRAVGATDVAGTYYEALSGGEQRRVCLGSTLVNDPDVLFLDEPTTGIDPAGRRTVWELIEEQVAGGTTVFLTTHDMREAARLADRVGLLADGDLVAVGDPDALVAEHGGEPSVLVTVDPREEVTDSGEDAAASGAGGLASRAVDALDAAGFDATLGSDATAGGDATSGGDAAEVRVQGVAARDVAAVADALDGADVPYSGLAWSEPSLEDVYLALAGERYEAERTGRRPRGDGATTPAAAPGTGGEST